MRTKKILKTILEIIEVLHHNIITIKIKQNRVTSSTSSYSETADSTQPINESYK